MRPKAIKVKLLENYMLEIVFNNGEMKLFDVKPYFKFKQFKELKNENEFRKVKIAGLSIEWENGADICPDELYYNSKKYKEEVDMEENKLALFEEKEIRRMWYDEEWYFFFLKNWFVLCTCPSTDNHNCKCDEEGIVGYIPEYRQG